MSDYPWSATTAQSDLPVVKIEVFPESPGNDIESGRQTDPVLIRLFGSGPKGTLVSWDVHPSTEGFTAVSVSDFVKTGRTPPMSLAKWHNVIQETYGRMEFFEPPESHLELKHSKPCPGADSTELIIYCQSTDPALAEFFDLSGHSGAFDASGYGCTARFTPTEKHSISQTITVKASVGLLKQPRLSALCIKFETCPLPGSHPELQYSGIFYLGGNGLSWSRQVSPCEGFTAVNNMDPDSVPEPSVYAWNHMIAGLAGTVNVGALPSISVQVDTAQSDQPPADTLYNWFKDTRRSKRTIIVPKAAPTLTLEWPGAGIKSTFRVIASSGWLRADLAPPTEDEEIAGDTS